jgi:uncharacterized protein YybS (DUF2232 family)
MVFPGRDLLLDATKGTVLTLALFLAYVTFPVLGLLPGIFTSLPGIYFYLKRGAAAGMTVLALTVTVLLMMGDASIPVLYLLQSGLTSLLLPFFFLQGKGMARAIAYAVGINFLLIVALAVGYGLSTGIDLQDLLVKGIETSTKQAITLYEKQGIKGEDIKLLTEGIQQAGHLIGRLFPALLLVTLGSIASLNMMAILRLAAKFLPELPKPDDFKNFRNPEMLVWVVIVAGFTVLLPYPDVSRVALNILLVVGFIYFLQGLAIVLSFFQRFAVPTFARIIFWLFVAFQPYLVLAIAIFGIFDVWGDFRTPKTKNL